MKFQFSGHESFVCKQFWLKKGYDFIQQEGAFNSEQSVVQLGVGKNMVTSINYWMKAFGIIDNSNLPTELGTFILDDQKGVDPYLENLGSIWLLHHALVKLGKASIYSLFFNEFRKEKFEFNREQLFNFLKRKAQADSKLPFTPKTLTTDIAVFVRNYLKPDYKGSKIDVEDDFSHLMIDLDLMDTYQSDALDQKVVDWYKVESKAREDLAFQIVLFAILDNEHYSNSISFKELHSGYNSPGAIFALSEEGLYHKIEQIIEAYKGNITYSESAGVREVQFLKKPNKWKVLHAYYKN